MKTVVGLFDTTAQAQHVRQVLLDQGYQAGQVTVVANDSGSTSDSSSTSAAGSSGVAGIGEKISSFFSSLAGGDEHAQNHYAKGVNEGGALLSVTTADEEAAEVASFLKQHGARDFDSGYQDEAESGVPVYGQTGSTQQLEGGTVIPIVEEQLVVGKREVDRGGVRIYSHVVERPVSADVTLREEHISVERRPVDRAATAADFTTGSDGFEVRASGEEAVVGKTSRVVEEVLVGKQTNERTEAIQDSVRKTEVEVEQLPGEVVNSRS